VSGQTTLTYRCCNRQNSSLLSTCNRREGLGIEVPPAVLSIADEVIE